MVRHEAAEALGALGDVVSRETIARSVSLSRARSLTSSPWLSYIGARALSLRLFPAPALALAFIARALALAGSPLLRL